MEDRKSGAMQSQFEVFHLRFSFCNCRRKRPPLPPLAKAGSGPRDAQCLRWNLCATLSIVAVVLLAAAPTMPADDVQPLWDPAGIEDFSLTECHGQTVTKADLLGKPWVACFIFTRCAGPCPRVSQQMQILQSRLKDLDVRLVSFSVDPENDTPEELLDYAKRYKADPEKWWFLTGDKRTIFRLIRRSFRMIVDDDPQQIPGFEVIHSIDIMHVDAAGV